MPQSTSQIAFKEKLDAVNKMVHALFLESMEQSGEGELFDALTMFFASNQQSETHNWLEDFAILREWIGPRQFASIQGKGVTIVNKEYEASIAIKRKDLRLDRTGLLQNRVRQLPTAWAKGRRKILVDLLLQGETTTGPGGAAYDGVAFFSAVHPNEAVGTQSNLMTGSALDATNFDLARKTMRLYVNHKNEPLDIEPDTLVIGPELEASAEQLFNTRTLANGGANRHFNAIPNIRVESRIRDTSWYLADSSNPVSPFIDQIVDPLELSSQFDSSSDRVFNYGEYAWGIYGFFGIGYGLWQTMIKNPGV